MLRNSFINRAKQKRDFKEIAAYMFSVLILVSGMLFYIWPHVRIIRMGYEFERLENMHQDMIQTNKVLRLEAASLKSLERIDRIARERLGLTFPDDDQIVILIKENK
ncbi:MAG: septum formation initiator family protein [Nitrospinota bacterium]